MAKRTENDDELVWRHVAKTVKPLPGKKTSPVSSTKTVSAAVKKTARPSAARTTVALAPSTIATDVDGRTAERLRRGQVRIDARLDLHGMTQDAAHAALNSFVKQHYEASHRCLLVITGKGAPRGRKDDNDWQAPRPGILRERVPGWLQAPRLRPMVLRVEGTQPRHGGDGALYVLLRRQRD